MIDSSGPSSRFFFKSQISFWGFWHLLLVGQSSVYSWLPFELNLMNYDPLPRAYMYLDFIQYFMWNLVQNAGSHCLCVHRPSQLRENPAVSLRCWGQASHNSSIQLPWWHVLASTILRYLMYFKLSILSGAHTHMHTHIHMYMCTHKYTHTYIGVHAHMRRHIYSYAYMHTHGYTHSQLEIQEELPWVSFVTHGNSYGSFFFSGWGQVLLVCDLNGTDETGDTKENIGTLPALSSSWKGSQALGTKMTNWRLSERKGPVLHLLKQQCLDAIPSWYFSNEHDSQILFLKVRGGEKKASLLRKTRQADSNLPYVQDIYFLSCHGLLPPPSLRRCQDGVYVLFGYIKAILISVVWLEWYATNSEHTTRFLDVGGKVSSEWRRKVVS